jgi:D-threo-aldose 1-dehydrogenase
VAHNEWRARLPRFGFGSSPFASLQTPVSDADAVELLEAVTTSATSYIDTAPFYGHGLAERRIGEFLRAHPDRRPMISTKVGRRLEPSGDSAGAGAPVQLKPVFDYSARGVRSTVEQSLQRLGRQSVDLLFVHDIGSRVHGADHPRTMALVEQETWPTLRELQAEGVTGGIGLGVIECEVVLECLDRGLIPDAVMLAGRYTLLETSAERTGLIERCQALGVTLIAAAPFNSGLLAGGDRFFYSPAKPPMWEARRRLSEVCEAFGVPLPAAALQFPLRNPAVASVVAGARSAAAFRQQLEWLDHPIPDDLWRALDGVRSAPTF